MIVIKCHRDEPQFKIGQHVTSGRMTDHNSVLHTKIAFKVIKEATEEDYFNCCREYGIDPTTLDREIIDNHNFYWVQMD